MPNKLLSTLFSQPVAKVIKLCERTAPSHGEPIPILSSERTSGNLIKPSTSP